MLNPKSKVGYYNRGLAFYNSKNYMDSLKDFNISIANNPEDSNAYLFRGNVKYILKKRKEACLDWNKSKELGNESAVKLISKICK